MRVLDRRDGTIVIKIHGCGESRVYYRGGDESASEINHIKIEFGHLSI